MGKNVVTMMFVVLFVVLIAITLVSIIYSFGHFSKGMSNTTETWVEDKDQMLKGNFMIYTIKYLDINVTEPNDYGQLCISNITDLPLVVEILFDLSRPPTACDIYLDGKYAKNLENLTNWTKPAR